MTRDAKIGMALGILGTVVLIAGGWWFLKDDRGEASLDPSSANFAIDVSNTELVTEGKAVYAQYCAQCHGNNLQGEPNWRERKANGRLPAPPHDESGHTWHHTDRQLFLLTKYGPSALIDGNYESDMPGFETVLTDRQIAASLAYIKSTWPEEILARQQSR